MGKKFALIILVILALILSACEQSAATPVPTAPKKGRPQASATLDPMEAFAIFGTQTKMAELGTPSDSLPPLDDGIATATPPGGIDQPTLDPLFPTPTGGIAQLATVTPQLAQPTVQTVRPSTYTLQQGEFIFCLARRFNVDVDQTLALNGLHDSETLYPGFTVKIPASGSFSGNRALKAHPTTYTVRSGESIYSIACLYGDVDPMNIAAVNGLAAPYNLTPGAQIQIP
jgi:LysM repeat protein